MSMTCRLATLSKLWTTTLNRSAGMGGGRCGSEARGNGGWDRNASDKADTFTTNGRNASFCSGTRKSQFQSVHFYFVFVHFFSPFWSFGRVCLCSPFFSIFSCPTMEALYDVNFWME